MDEQTQATQSDERVINLARNPDPNAEAESQFMTEEERLDKRNKDHELAMLSKRQGLIGKIIGSSVPSLNIAFFLLTITLAVISGMIFWGDYNQLKETIDKLIALELTIVGYILGKGANDQP